MIYQAGASDIHLILLLIFIRRFGIENERSFEEGINDDELYISLLYLFLNILAHAFRAEVNNDEGHSYDSEQNVSHREKHE